MKKPLTIFGTKSWSVYNLRIYFNSEIDGSVWWLLHDTYDGQNILIDLEHRLNWRGKKVLTETAKKSVKEFFAAWRRINAE